MDLQESKRLFGVVATDAASAQAWWDANAAAECFLSGPVESAIQNWFVQMGGSAFTVGKYDIYNAFEWYYQPFYTNIPSATVAPDGTTTVTIDHSAWGTEVLLGRLFYWGATSYAANYLDSTQAAGWWGQEISWIDRFQFDGNFSANAHSFVLATDMHYHFQNLGTPGPDGVIGGGDDGTVWTWGPMLIDYVDDFSPKHLLSELDRGYDTMTLVQSTPGHPNYGGQGVYDFVPTTWDLQAGETHIFHFPTGDVVTYNPNLTPLAAHPYRDYVGIIAPIAVVSTKPAGWGTYDPLANTLTIVGPATTGGPNGSPGNYPVLPWPEINLGPAEVVIPVTEANLVKKSAWPERHHFDLSTEAAKRDTTQSLFALVANVGTESVDALVTFDIYTREGVFVMSLESAVVTLADPGQSAVVEVGWTDPAPGRYTVFAQALYDSDGNGTLDALGTKVKRFGFAVVP